MAPVWLPCSRDRPCRPARPDSVHREKAGVDRVRGGRRCQLVRNALMSCFLFMVDRPLMPTFLALARSWGTFQLA